MSQAFLLQPVSEDGMITEQELVIFGVCVMECAEKYKKMKAMVAAMKAKEDADKNAWKARKQQEKDAKAKRKKELKSRVDEQKV